MAAKKWPKWLAGVSSVVSFTTFLYLTQNHGGYTENKNFSESDQPVNTQEIFPFPSLATPIDFTVKSAGQVKTFIHSREEMLQIQKLALKDKSEREQLLEHLDWNEFPQAEVTLPPVKNKITEAATASSAVKKPEVKVKVKSERRTKRS